MLLFFFWQTWSECPKASRRKYVSMWCPEPAFLKENTEFSYFELR